MEEREREEELQTVVFLRQRWKVNVCWSNKMAAGCEHGGEMILLLAGKLTVIQLVGGGGGG